MGWSGGRTRSPAINGELGLYRLGNWWLATFTEAERAHIERVYQPIGAGHGARPLTQGVWGWSSGNAVKLLTSLAGWFQEPEDRDLARRFLSKAEELAPAASILDAHALYQAKIETYYRDRHDPAALAQAIHACEQQIALAPQVARAFKRKARGQPLPGHAGYRRLIAMRHTQGDFLAARALAKQAQRQGWQGDWASEIAECKAQLAIARRKVARSVAERDDA
jgi:hypothetical protein